MEVLYSMYAGTMPALPLVQGWHSGSGQPFSRPREDAGSAVAMFVSFTEADGDAALRLQTVLGTVRLDRQPYTVWPNDAGSRWMTVGLSVAQDAALAPDDEATYAFLDLLNVEWPPAPAGQSHPDGLETAMARLMRRARDNRVVDEDSTQDAADALYDGLKFADLLASYAPPRVGFSTDGVLTLEWLRDGRGVLMTFPGGGTATYSTKAAGGFYSTLITEFLISGGVPDELGTALEQLAGA